MDYDKLRNELEKMGVLTTRMEHYLDGPIHRTTLEAEITETIINTKQQANNITFADKLQ